MRSFLKFLSIGVFVTAVIGGTLALLDYLYETYAKHYISTENED